MIIYLKEDKIFSLDPTDSRKLPAGFHIAINYEYCSRVSNLIYTPKVTFGKEIKDLIKEREMFIVYFKRQYYGVWKDECEIPKTYNGWFNL